MDSQGPLPDVGASSPNDVSTANPPANPPAVGKDVGATNPNDVSTANPPAAVGTEFRVQGSSIPPAPLFQGFPHPVSQLPPFYFPHHFMPPLPGVGFAPPTQGGPSATIHLTAGSHKRVSQECVTDQSRSTKKQRVLRKKTEIAKLDDVKDEVEVLKQSKSTKKRRVARETPEIVELDDVKDEVEVPKSGGHWKDPWVIQLINIRREMHDTFSAPPKQGVDNWSRLRSKLVSLCPDFLKDSEACRKKWQAICNSYKEDKANMKSGSQRSEKCRWYQLVDEFMFDSANVVSHAQANATDGDGVKCTTTSDTNTTEHRDRESTSKSPEPKRKEDMFLERCIAEIRESSKSLMESFKANEDMKMALLMSMQQTMQKLVDKL